MNNKGRILVRKSGTEPKIRIMAESNNKHLIKKCISFFDENRPNGHLNKIELIKGNAVKTIPKYIKENPHLLVSFLYIDFDLYVQMLLQYYL